ncbi:sensor histidine kinase [Microbacterium sp. gxy059]|uniref:sensor histidine kinase n=1 Tax=Microbacterium sp. gxy059 TaxID=2957199 RepID=UPI003D99C90F
MDAASRSPSGPPLLVDIVLAGAMALVVALVVAASASPSGPPSPLVYGFAALFGALLLLRRRLPRTMLAVTVLAVFAYYTLDLAPIGIALPAAAALFACAEAGRTGFAAASGVVLVGTAAFFLVRDGEPTTYLIGSDLLTNLALVAAAIACGVAVRRTREARAQAARIRSLTESERAHAIRRARQDERVRIARELHDTVGHALSIVSVHAAVASEAIGGDEATTATAVGRIRETATRSLQELRATVRILRTEDEPTPRASGLSDMEGLARTARDAGLEVALSCEVEQKEVDAAVAAAAFRVVQESLTNVLRHARATRVEIALRREGARLVVRIADDGVGRGAGDDGSGITGMRERVRLLGGSLAAHDGRFGGFLVEATLPARLAP